MKPKTVLWLTVGGFALLVAGCGKHSETQAQNQAAATAADNSQAPANSQGPAPATTPAVAGSNPATDANGAADLGGLSRQLRGWIVGHRRLPQSFEEFVSSANLKVPPPPPGKKYAINKSTVVLVDR
jgi:hypothetical protein